METHAKELISDDENAMAMIADLKKQLENVKSKNETLEEECDLLAMENDRLRTLCQRNGIDPDHIGEERQDISPDACATSRDDEEFLVDAGGDEGYACHDGRVIREACGSGNVLCVDFLQLPHDDDKEEFVLCGGVDKTLRLYALHSGELLCELLLAAPLLSIDCSGPLVACSMMDGSHAVVDLRVQSCSELLKGLSPDVVQNQRDHTKYAVSIKWSPCGEYLATASHDKTVVLYKRAGGGIRKLHTLNLKDIPEDVEFCLLPADFTTGSESGVDKSGVEISGCPQQSSVAITGSDPQLHLIVPTRGSVHLLYINCLTMQHRKVSLNEHAWDSHVSFNVLHLALSPDGKQLLVATDKDFHLILKTGTNKRLSLLAGHMCNDYGKPKTCWDVTGKYVYSNNQADHNLLVYAVNTGKIVATLTGHRGQIRDIRSHSTNRTVLTASYDHTVKEWLPTVDA